MITEGEEAFEEELAKLRDEGILSEEEFQKKEEILGLERDEEDGGSR